MLGADATKLKQIIDQDDRVESFDKLDRNDDATFDARESKKARKEIKKFINQNNPNGGNSITILEVFST